MQTPVNQQSEIEKGRTEFDITSMEGSRIFGILDKQSHLTKEEIVSTSSSSKIEAPAEDIQHHRYPQIPGIEIEEELASGGFGIVYRARQTSLNRVVALKMLHFSHTFNNVLRARFLTEALHLARINHHGIVKVIKGGEHESILYMVMEFVDGVTLDTLVKQQELSITDKAEIMLQVAEAIHHSHEMGIIHRDLKPSNILITSSTSRAHSKPYKTTNAFQVKVTDFGLAVTEYDKRVTLPNQIVGTPAYSSPEQLTQSEITSSSDIFNMGVVLYELLTGILPFDGVTLQKQTVATLHFEPVRPRQLSPSLAKDLETICLKCLEKKPEDRYVSAMALAKDLNRYLLRKPIIARPLSTFEKGKRLILANPTLSAIVILLLVTLLGSTISVASLLYRSETEKSITERALQQAYQNFQYARESVDKLLIVLNDRMNDSDDVNQVRKELLQNSLEFYQKILRDQPDSLELLECSASAWLKVGQLYHSLGDCNQAQQAFDKSLEIVNNLLKMQPAKRFEHQLLEARLLHNKADTWMSTSNDWEAVSIYRVLLEKCKALSASDSISNEARVLHASATSSLAAILGRHRKSVESFALYQRALEENELLVSQHPQSASYLEQSIQTRSRFVSSFSAKLGKAQTLANLERNISDAEIASRIDLSRPQPRYLMALGLNNLADFHYRHGHHSTAEQALQRAENIIEELLRKRPSNIAYASLLGTIKLTQGEVYNKLKQPNRVVSSLDDAIHQYRSILERNSQHRTACLYLWLCYRDRARAYEQLGQYDLAISDVELSLSTGQGNEREQLLLLLERIRQHQRIQDLLRKL